MQSIDELNSARILERS